MKFKDADLIGVPLRVTVGAKDLAGGVVEFKDRASGKVEKVGTDGIIDYCVRQLEVKGITVDHTDK